MALAGSSPPTLAELVTACIIGDQRLDLLARRVRSHLTDDGRGRRVHLVDLHDLLGGRAGLAGGLHLHVRLRQQGQHLDLAGAGLIDRRLEHLDGARVVAHGHAEARRRDQRVEARGVTRELLAHLLEVRGGVLEAARFGSLPTERDHHVGEELRLVVLLDEALADLPGLAAIVLRETR